MERQRLKLLVVDQASQAFAAYEFGHQVRWGPVNSGRATSQTPSGLFHLNWRSPGRHSTVNSAWFFPWYYNIENHEGSHSTSMRCPAGRPVTHAFGCSSGTHGGYSTGEKDGRSTPAGGKCSNMARPSDSRVLQLQRASAMAIGTFLSEGIPLPGQPSVAQTECESLSR